MNKATAQSRQTGNTLIILMVAVVFVVAGILVGNRMLSGTHELALAQPFPQPRPVGAFSLERGDGSAFTQDDLQGQWNLVFFGFTHCPDVCPDTLAMLASVMEDMAHKTRGALPRVVFVSVDPQRDRGSNLDDYVQWFNPAFVGITGDDDQLGMLTRQLGIVYYYEAVDGDSGFYNVDHSTAVLVVDPQGRVVARFTPPLDRDGMVADLFRLTS